MRSMNALKHSTITLAVATALATSTAYAQQQPSDDGADSDQGVERIMVTAQRRLQNVQDVPVSVSSLDQESLGNYTAGGADIRSLSGKIPSLNIESSMGRTYPRFYIRGLGNSDFDMNSSQPVSVILDDVVMENPMLKGFPMFDVARTEVLRGPQGTLFGRNTPAGIVKFESVRPSQDFNGYLKAGYGRFNSQQYEGAVGGGLTDTLSARVSGTYQHRDDWVDNVNIPGGDDLGGYDDSAVRGQLLWKPSSKFDALLNVHSRHLNGTSRVFHADSLDLGSNHLNDRFDLDKVDQDGRNRQRVDEFGSVLTMNAYFDAFTLTSITGYEKLSAYSLGDVDGGIASEVANIPYSSETADGIDGLDQWSEELRISANLTPDLFYQAGVYFFRDDVDISSYDYNTADDHALDGLVKTTQVNKSYAVFGQIQYDWTPDLTISAGLRYTWDKKTFDADRVIDASGNGVLYNDPVHTNDHFWSWDLAANYRLTDDVSLYSRLARASRAPSIQGRLQFADDITVADTETLTSIETGFKSDLLDNTMRLNMDVYYYQMDDQQLTATGGATNVTRLLNADKTKGYGLEADIEYRPIRNLTLNGSASYNNTEIDDDNLHVAACGAGCTVRDPVVDGQAYIDGNDLPQAPKWILDFSARYDLYLDSGASVYFMTDWSYRSKINLFLYDSVEFTGRPMTEGGVRIGYTTADGKYDIAAYARNITDEERMIGAMDFNNRAVMPNEPRIFGVEATMNF